MKTQRPTNRPDPADMQPWTVIEKLQQSNAELLETLELITISCTLLADTYEPTDKDDETGSDARYAVLVAENLIVKAKDGAA